MRSSSMQQCAGAVQREAAVCNAECAVCAGAGEAAQQVKQAVCSAKKQDDAQQTMRRGAKVRSRPKLQ
jgi:hypothetical protein